MRKRPILLGACALSIGLAVLGTVCAQTPFGQSRTITTPTYAPPEGGVKAAGGYLPPPTGYTPPTAQGQPARPRLTNPVMAGPEGVRPVSGGQIPPPSMDLAAAPPAIEPAPPAGTLPPPSVMIEPPPASLPALPPGVTPVPLPVPAPGSLEPAAPPAVPIPPVASGSTPAPLPLIPGPGTLGSTPVIPAADTPTRVAQNVNIEAVCPETVVFGQEFRYELILRNSGTSSVSGVCVEDEVPGGTTYIGSDPPAEQSGGRLIWSVGTLEAGAEKKITVRVKPSAEGELRSRATVTVTSSVDAKTKVTRPRIAASVTGGGVCKAGEDALFQIKVTNSGTGPAKRMIVQALLSDGLTHPQGMKLEMEMANLAPGETRTVPLKAGAVKSGMQWCQVTVATEGSPDSIAKAQVNVVEALLQVAQTGPTKCLVRAEPTYEITLSNPGTATTDPVTLYAVLPEGFEYVQSSDNAAYSPTNRAVTWKLSGLAAGATKPVTLKLRAAAAGDGLLRTIAQTTPDQPVVGLAGGVPAKPAGRVLEAKTETAVKSEGLAAVRFEVLDLDDPIEVGKEAVYEIRVMNQGTGACTNIQLVAATAEGTEYKSSSGPTQVKAQGQHLVFEPIATLAPKGEMVYRVKVCGLKAGDLRFRVQLTCDQVRTPIVKEESTRFYKQ